MTPTDRPGRTTDTTRPPSAPSSRAGRPDGRPNRPVGTSIDRRGVLKGLGVLPAVAAAGCTIGGSGAYDATVRNGTDEHLEISIQVTDGDSTPVDTSLRLAPAETAELDPSENTFKQASTYTVEVDAGGDRRDTYEYEADNSLVIVARSDTIAFLIQKG